MSEEIKINIEIFSSYITNLHTVTSNLHSDLSPKGKLESTNIEPFTEDLETIVDAIDLLDRYKQMLDSDIDILEELGEKIDEKDKEIAQKTS